ncbi:MAG: ABC transporter ATP-binding protein [Microcoleaceae cyanobacterium]
MSIITTQNLSKSYPVAVKAPGIKGTLRHFFQRTYMNVNAVKDITFSIEAGEMVGFLGPNGAGKTTTLKMLTGLIYPSTGTVQVVGEEPFQRQPSFLQQITLVMGQKQQLIWDLPILDSLRINGAVYGLSDRQYEQRVGELTEMLSLQGKLQQAVRKLSLGERMKAELMAALLHRPQILFLDEPTLGLDVNAQVAVRNFLREYNERYQATILLTSHYMADITALCKRVLLIYQGILIYDGSLDGLVTKFSPYREVQVELLNSLSDDPEKCQKILAEYGEVQSLQGQSARLLVKRSELTKMVAKILADLEILDLTVTDPPIEDVIGRVFSQGTAN